MCGTTSPAAISNLGTIPFADFQQCLPVLESVDCSNPDYKFGVDNGFGNEGASFYKHSLLPTGTSSLFNRGGVMSSPVSGSSLVWNILGMTQASDLATAIMSPFSNAATTATTILGTAGEASSGASSTSTGSNQKSGTLKITLGRSNRLLILGGLLFPIALL